MVNEESTIFCLQYLRSHAPEKTVLVLKRVKKTRVNFLLALAARYVAWETKHIVCNITMLSVFCCDLTVFERLSFTCTAVHEILLFGELNPLKFILGTNEVAYSGRLTI